MGLLSPLLDSIDGGGTPGGSSGELQYNNSGAFGGLTIGSGLSNTSGALVTTTETPAQMAAQNNANALLLPHFRAKLGATKAPVPGTQSNTRILCIGDSITEGAYSDSAAWSSGSNWPALAWPNQLAKMFQASGVNASGNCFSGYSSTSPAIPDQRISSTMLQSMAFSLGGNFFYATSSQTFSFTPTAPVDTFVVWYITTTSAATFAYDINSVFQGTQSQTASNNLTSLTISAPLGINTLTLSKASGTGDVYFVGIDSYNSQQSNVLINNAGWNGATTTDWVNDVDPPYSTLPAIGKYAPDLSIIMLGINDMLPVSGPIAVATTIANLQTIIIEAQASGDVVLATYPPAVVASTVPLATQQTYISAIQALATTNNIPLVDIFSRWVSYEYSNPLGLYWTGTYPANLHPVGQGHADIAQAIFNVIGNP